MKTLTNFLMVGLWFASTVLDAKIESIWFTHDEQTPDSIVVSWVSEKAGNSVVRFGTDKNLMQEIRKDGDSRIHHIRIPFKARDCELFYQVETGEQKSEIKALQTYPSKGKEFRIAFVGNMGGNASRLSEMAGIFKPHLLMTLGDNLPHLYKLGAYKMGSTLPYEDLLKRGQKILPHCPFMPILGNHDKQMTPRGKKRPTKENPVYDVNATSYCNIFALPSPEWHWQMVFPDFDFRIVALDTNHISDMGTGWQSCHPVDVQSEQFKWYSSVMANAREKFIITLYNESNGGMRHTAKGAWVEHFRKGSLCISGYGNFLEFAITKDGVIYANNSAGKGDHYKDKANAIFSELTGGFLMLRFTSDGKLFAEFYDRIAKKTAYVLEIPSRPVPRNK